LGLVFIGTNCKGTVAKIVGGIALASATHAGIRNELLKRYKIMDKNYYLILGLPADASREDVKNAFRRRALELHPDRSGMASGPFQDVQEAYSVLADPERRRRYDHQFQSMSSGRSTSTAIPEPLIPKQTKAEPLIPIEKPSRFREVFLAESFESYHPSFDELFHRFWSNFETAGHPKSEKVESLVVEVVLSADDAIMGGRVMVWIPARVTCRACAGKGAVGLYQCWLCEGHGTFTTDQPLHIDYPAGLRNDFTIRVPLTAYGIDNFFLTVLFRVSAA
jgi:DnaJ-class molecular chaperone